MSWQAWMGICKVTPLVSGLCFLLTTFLDLLKVISTTQKVCLVTLDTAGLTTSKDDLASFLLAFNRCD
jgi:hypothetical protein